MLTRSMTSLEATQQVNALFAEWYGPLLRYSVRLTGSLSMGEDFVQEAFLSYFRALTDQRSVACPKAYTMAAIRHQAQRAWAQRRMGRIPSSIDDVVDTLVVVSDEERTIIWDDLQRLIGELTPREVEVLLLRAEALTYREIGNELGIATTSVGTLLARALRKLQTLTSGPVPRELEVPEGTASSSAASLKASAERRSGKNEGTSPSDLR